MELIDKTVSDCLRDRAKNTPDGVFLHHGDEIFTWKYMDDLTDRVAMAMMEQGIRLGDRVGILGVNSASWIISFLSIQKLGAVSVLINPCFKERELIGCIEMADITHIFYTSLCAGKSTDDMMNRVTSDRRCAHVKIYNIEKTYQQWHKLATRRIATPRELPENLDSNDLACVLFTSGTTNNCKGVMLSHYSIVNNARAVVEAMRWNEDDRMCLAVPLFHCFGITVSLLTSIIAGMSISLIHKYKTMHVCDVIAKNKCTVINGVPSMFLAMVKNPRMKNYDLTSLRSGIIAGSPIFEEEYREICEHLAGVRLQTSYGLTEASPCVTISEYDDSIDIKSKTSGKLIDHVSLRIVDLNTSKECARGHVGEIYVKGYNVTKGYLSNEAVLCDAVQSNGWLRTGDLGYLDEDAYLHIAGRRKNLIIRGGENISPIEIEQFIKEVKPGIEVYVFGMKSEVLQEEIVACIEGKHNDDLIEKIRDFLSDNISEYKIPSYFVFVNRFPKNPTGKVNEKELKYIATEILSDEVKLRAANRKKNKNS